MPDLSSKLIRFIKQLDYITTPIVSRSFVTICVLQPALSKIASQQLISVARCTSSQRDSLPYDKHNVCKSDDERQRK